MKFNYKVHSFKVSVDHGYVINMLNDEQAGKIFKYILKYMNGEDIIIDDLLLEIVFIQIKQQILNDLNLNKLGGNHWNWKGGKSKENHLLRNSAKMKDWRKYIFERDHFTCQNCGKYGGKLNAHHIKKFSEYPLLRFDVNNGITLCKSCHIKLHKKI